MSNLITRQASRRAERSGWATKRTVDRNEPRKNSFRRSALNRPRSPVNAPKVPTVPISRAHVLARHSLLLALLKSLSKTEVLAMLHFVVSYIEKEEVLGIIRKLTLCLNDKESCSLLRAQLLMLPDFNLVRMFNKVLETIDPSRHLTALLKVMWLASKDDTVSVMCNLLKHLPALQTISLLHCYLISLPEHDPIESTNKILAHIKRFPVKGINSSEFSLEQNFIDNLPLTSSPKPSRSSVDEETTSVSGYSSAVLSETFSQCIEDNFSDFCSNVTSDSDGYCSSGELDHSPCFRDEDINGSQEEAEAEADTSKSCHPSSTEKNYIQSDTMAKFRVLQSKMDRVEMLMKRLEEQMLQEDESV